MALIEGFINVKAEPATAKIEGQVLDPTEWFESERPDQRRDAKDGDDGIPTTDRPENGDDQ